MKKEILLLLLVLILNDTFGQIADNWVFGYRGGLNFKSGTPTYFSNSISNKFCFGTTSNDTVSASFSNSISDCNGDLLFYTNGMCVWNKSGQLMPDYCLNDTIFNLGYVNTKILKFLNNDSLYYIFYTVKSYGLRYAIINMNLDGGGGSILSSHNYINSFPSITTPEIIKHSNDSNYWLVCKPTATQIFSYLITSAGISLNPVISSAPGFLSNNSFLKASLSGKYLFYQDYTASSTLNNGYCCDFNRSTGSINFIKTLFSYTNFPTNYYLLRSVEFSPNDSFVYLSISAPPGSNAKIYQLKRFIGTPGLFPVELTYNTNNNMPGMQIAPDGKIYLSNYYTGLISCIKRPNENGLGCNFINNYINISPNKMWGGFPSVYFPLKTLKFNAESFDIGTCITDSLRFFAQGDTDFKSYNWYIYDTINQIVDSANIKNPVFLLPEGHYNIKLKAKNPTCNSYTWSTDDIYVSYKPDITASIDSIKISCSNQTIYLHFNSLYKDSVRINWGDGSFELWNLASGNINVSHNYYDSSKIYIISITAINLTCSTIVTFKDTVTLEPRPKAKIYANNYNYNFPIRGCALLNFSLIDSSTNADSTWFITSNNIVKSPLLITNRKLSIINCQLSDTGWYNISQYVKTKDGCYDSTTVNNAIYIASPPSLKITIDTMLNPCIQDYLRLKVDMSFADSLIVNWGDGTITKLKANISGHQTNLISHTYLLKGRFTITINVKNNFCDLSDSLHHLVRYPLSMQISNDTIICIGGSAKIIANATGADSIFTYLFHSPFEDLKSQNGSFFVSPKATTNYQICAINTCAGDSILKSVTVQVNPSLSLSVNSTDTSICKGNLYELKATASGGNGNYFFILKSKNLFLTSKTGIFHLIVDSNQLYTLLLTDSCTKIGDSLRINIKVIPVLHFMSNIPDQFLCDGEIVKLIARINSGSGIVKYFWNDQSGNPISTMDTFSFQPTATTTIILVVSDNCSTIVDTFILYKFPTVSGTSLKADQPSGCAPLMVFFETPEFTYSNTQPLEADWDFGDGYKFIQNFNKNISTIKQKHIFLNEGVYEVKVELKFTSNNKFCLILKTTVEARINPKIILNIVPKKITLPKTQCIAYISTANSDSFVIDWGDGFTEQLNFNLSSFIIKHNYLDTGHFEIEATAFNKNNCSTTESLLVNHSDTFSCFVPNAFSPNNDAKNESFKPVVSYCKNYELIIFDRWGAEVFRTNYIYTQPENQGWTGEESETGLFIYMLNAISGDGINYNYKGVIMLLK